jgi:hypothetical protein
MFTRRNALFGFAVSLIGLLGFKVKAECKKPIFNPNRDEVGYWIEEWHDDTIKDGESSIRIVRGLGYIYPEYAQEFPIYIKPMCWSDDYYYGEMVVRIEHNLNNSIRLTTYDITSKSIFKSTRNYNA